MTLRLAIDYSARETLARAAAGVENATTDSFADSLQEVLDPHHEAGDVDLLIRTSGEQRLSDFLLWESAYAELLFLDTLWPDFEVSDLEEALDELSQRQRRFGGLPEDPRVEPGDGPGGEAGLEITPVVAIR